jgi:hypothetical protein
MDMLQAAYMAGVMDSDGWFTIRRHACNKAYKDSYTYSEFAGCGQTSPEAVELLHATFGGPVRIRTRKVPGDWKPMYYWVVSNAKAAEVARVLRPHLRVKAAHADLILALRASKDTPRDHSRSVATGLRGRALDPAVVAQRHAFYKRIRSMNDRRQSNLDLAAS